ncbi:MAG: hypothetical protein KDE20_13790 [Caldilineaceae bacterium]|nr:hypothetical protein [Caldilineaceae bacterium]
MMQQEANGVKWMYGQVAVAAADDTDSDGAALDMQDYDGAFFVVPIEDSVATGVATLTAKQCDTSGGIYAALSGAVATATSATNDDLNTKLLIVDVYRPQERYLKANVKSVTANIAFGTLYQFAYKGRKSPVAQIAAEVAQLTCVASPAEA